MAQALRGSPNQGNREENFEENLTNASYLFFTRNHCAGRYFFRALALTTIPAVINEFTNFKLRFLQN